MNQTLRDRQDDGNMEIHVDQTDTDMEAFSVHRKEGDLRELNLSNNYLFVKVMEDRDYLWCCRVSGTHPEEKSANAVSPMGSVN